MNEPRGGATEGKLPGKLEQNPLGRAIAQLPPRAWLALAMFSACGLAIVVAYGFLFASPPMLLAGVFCLGGWYVSRGARQRSAQ